jgi:hypothetical protein
MLSRSLRTAQLTQITGIAWARKALIRRLSGWMGRRLGETSIPMLSIQPPLAQKSFCMSTSSSADLFASTTMFCGSASMASARTAGAGRVMSAVRALTCQAWPAAAPIVTDLSAFIGSHRRPAAIDDQLGAGHVR